MTTEMRSITEIICNRILTSSVVRRGISENLSESSQLMTLRQLTSACRSSVSSISADGGSGAKRGANTDDHKRLNRHQLQVALVEISHLIVALGEAGASSLEDLLPVLRDSLSHADAGVRHEASAVYASISQAFPTEGRTFVIECLGTFGANLDAIQSLSRVTAASSPAPRSRFRHSNNNDQNIGTTPTAELMKHQATLHGNALAVSMLMHEFPHIIGGIATVIVSKVFDVVGKLLECQFNEGFVKVGIMSSFLFLVFPFFAQHSVSSPTFYVLVESKRRLHLHQSGILLAIRCFIHGYRCCCASPRYDSIFLLAKQLP